MSEPPTLELMMEQLKKLYLEHDQLITEHNKIIIALKQKKEDIEMLELMIMYKSNKEARI
jgi:hypothetical protein